MDEYVIGHRDRLRERYIKNQDALSDYEILELLLTFSIPRMDVKPLAKDLIKHFHSLENVFSATPSQLMSISGVGEKTAILINLFTSVQRKIYEERNTNVKQLDTTEKSVEYVKNLLLAEKNEKVIIVCLDNSNRVICAEALSDGTVNMSEVNSRKVVGMVLTHNAASVIIAHNHPKGSEIPSASDIGFTIGIRDALNNIGVNLIDHIIVGEKKSLSMRLSPEYKSYFK